jgi:hypothetical protein
LGTDMWKKPTTLPTGPSFGLETETDTF